MKDEQTLGVPASPSGSTLQPSVSAAIPNAAAEAHDPTDPGRDVEVLREHVRHLERRVRELSQAQPNGTEPAAYISASGEPHLTDVGRGLPWGTPLYTAAPSHAPTSDAKRAYELAQELAVTEKLLAERQRVLDAIPACPDHGPCVPHALEWIEKAKAVARRCAEIADDLSDNGLVETAIRKEFGLEEMP